MTTDHSSTLRLDELEHNTARHLLELCEQRSGTPAARLMTRLARDDGADWASRELRSFTTDEGANGLAILLEGAGGLTAAKTLKRAGKRGMKESADAAAEARAVLLYLSAVASALAHHNRLISSRKPSVLVELFMDLAEVLDGPLRPVFERAVEAAIAHDTAVSRLRKWDGGRARGRGGRTE